MSTHPLKIDRRTLLKASTSAGALVAGRITGVQAALAAAHQQPAVERVIIVAFAGGVRSRDTFGTPGNVPVLEEMAREGVLWPRMRTSNLGHYGASLSIFTGISEPRGIRENTRGPDPTMFEYLRKQLGLPASEVWVSTSGGAQQSNYAYGLHRDYGASYGANTLDGDGVFNSEFKGVLARLGRPRAIDEGERDVLAELRRSLRTEDGVRSPNSPESAARVEEYILTELTRGTSELRGPNAADAKAIRVARNLVSIFRPKVTAIVLQQADIAHGSYNGYLEVIRRNDAALGELWRAIREDPALAESTAIFVCPEFGRDSDLNSRRGLDHGDGSDDLRYVTGVGWGPGLGKGRVVQEEVRVVDLCPTVCELLGASAPLAEGRRLKRLFG